MSRRESNNLHIIYQALDLKISRAEKIIVVVRLDSSRQITHKGRDLRYQDHHRALAQKTPDKPHLHSRKNPVGIRS